MVKVKREPDEKVRLTQERFTVNFKSAPPLLWKIPLTYSVVGEAPATLLMAGKTAELDNIPADRALKLNVNGAGNYRVEYDVPSWNRLLDNLSKLSVDNRVNLLSDSWALAEADRAPVSLYFGLVEKLPASTDLAEREQIIEVTDFINRLLIGSPQREKFQRYARSLLRITFGALGWEPTAAEPLSAATLRASLIQHARRFKRSRKSLPVAANVLRNISPSRRPWLPICVRQFWQWSAGMLTRRFGTNCTSLG